MKRSMSVTLVLATLCFFLAYGASADARRVGVGGVRVARTSVAVRPGAGIGNRPGLDRWGRPVARGVAVGAAIGTRVAMLPGGCTTVYARGVAYSQCGGAYYQPVYQGTSVVYVVLANPF
jgi:hypothetical protein